MFPGQTYSKGRGGQQQPPSRQPQEASPASFAVPGQHMPRHQHVVQHHLHTAHTSAGVDLRQLAMLTGQQQIQQRPIAAPFNTYPAEHSGNAPVISFPPRYIDATSPGPYGQLPMQPMPRGGHLPKGARGAGAGARGNSRGGRGWGGSAPLNGGASNRNHSNNTQPHPNQGQRAVAASKPAISHAALMSIPGPAESAPAGGGSDPGPQQGRRPGRKVNPDDMSTWTNNEFHAMIQAFLKDNSTTKLSFPPTLSAQERQNIHKIAMHFGLLHESSGPASRRVLTLEKKGQVTATTKSIAAAHGAQIQNGARVKTIDGYQGAQVLPDEFVLQRAGEIEELARPLHKQMIQSIRHEAMKPRRHNHTVKIGQPGLSTPPPQRASQERFKELQAFRMALPSMKRKSDIIAAVNENDVVVICGDTGCGKTTQVPQMLFDAKIFPAGSKIVCTQPRRISAISVANRVAEERGEVCGATCGYTIRFENVTSEKSKILFVTTGIFLRWLHVNADLPGIACVIIDEAHEREVETDFALLLLRDRLLRQQHQPHNAPGRIKVVVMSATIQISRFEQYLREANGNRSPPVISIPGTLFRVNDYFLEDALVWLKMPADSVPVMEMLKEKEANRQSRKAAGESTGVPQLEGGQPNDDSGETNWNTYNKLKDTVFYESNQEPEAMVAYEVVHKLIERFHSSAPDRSGAILVFLPGWAAIDRVASSLRKSPMARSLSVLMLHSTLTSQEQQRVFFPPPRGFRKVVLATSIAETSITIDDIVFVIDCCLLKGTSYDPAGNTSALKASFIGKANGLQRRGRAGRCQEGICVHLLPKAFYEDLPDFLPPQIVRTPLEEVCLQLKAISGKESCVDVLARALDPPPIDAVAHSVELLKDMGAFDSHEALTNVGRALAQMPIHPQLGKMLFVATCLGVLQPVAVIAASLSQKSPFVKPMPHQRVAARQCLMDLDQDDLSDHLCTLRLFNGWKQSRCSADFAMQRFADPTTLRSIDRAHQQLVRLVTTSTSLLKGIANPAAFASRHENNLGLVRFAMLWSMYPRIGTIEYRLNRDTGRANLFCWDNKPAELSLSSALAMRKRNHYLDKTFIFYYERMLLESVLNVFDATAVSPVEVALCVGSLDIQPLRDIPMALRIDPASKLGPAAPYTDVENPPADAIGLVFDGGKKLFITAPKVALAIRLVRECMDYYFALSITRVSAAMFPEKLVHAIGLIIGFKVEEKTVAVPTTAMSAIDASDDAPDSFSAKRSAGGERPSGPAFTRAGWGHSSDDDDSDDGPIMMEEDEELDLTEEQLRQVTAQLGDLAVLRSYSKTIAVKVVAQAPSETTVDFSRGGADGTCTAITCSATQVIEAPDTVLPKHMPQGRDIADDEDEEDDVIVLY